MKRKWTNETAEVYIQKVQKGREPIGMKYLSALDFLKNHRIISKHSILGF